MRAGLRAAFAIALAALPVANGSGEEAGSAKIEVADFDAAGVSIGGFAEPLPEGIDWRKWLRVTVAAKRELPAVAGRYRIVGKELRFEPHFPFSSRAEYWLEFRHPRFGELKATLKLGAPVDDLPPAEVAVVYPSAGRLPQNLLKFYIHFSRPMSQGEAYRHLQLIDGEGEVVADPFLELAEELWDDEGKRLTVLLDPGRVKRGLKPHEEVGPVLHPGEQYRLEIDGGWKDAARRPLAKGFAKRFVTLPPDYRSPDPEGWDFTLPAPGTRDPLIVDFGESLDHALCERLLEVRDKSKSRVPGEGRIFANETRWQFTPKRPWRAGAYRLHAGSELEDLAGNSIRSPFEVTPENPGRAFVGPTVSRGFTLAPASGPRR